MRNDEHEGAYIWLRQSARFGLGDQERTVEIAIPVRPGASPEEIERLLEEADAGMERLSLHLDQRIAALIGVSRVPSNAAGTTERTPGGAVTPTSASQGTSPAARASAPAADIVVPPAPPAGADAIAGEKPVTTPAGQDDPHHMERVAAAPGEHHVAESPPPSASARPTAPARPDPAHPEPATPTRATGPAARPPAPRATPGATAPTPGAAPARPAAERSEPAGTPERGPDLTRADFLAQAAGMGLNPKQVMERLGVRTLEGLNLREALELLRRQLVRDAGAQATEPDPPVVLPVRQEPRPAATARSAASSTGASSAPREPTADGAAPAGAYFDEEDDLEVSFALPDDEPDEMDTEYLGYTADAAADGGAELDDEAEEADLDEVPALEESDLDVVSPAPATSAAGRRGPAASTRAAGRPQASTARQQTAKPEQPAAERGAQLGLAQRTRAREVLEKLRAEPPGGAPGRDQLTAYRNIVVRELGAQQASALVQEIWRAQPERLGTDQMYALISWGKTDGFAEEARTLLALLQAQRAASEMGEPDGGQASASPARPASGRSPGRGPGSSA